MAPYTNFRTVPSTGSTKTEGDASTKDIRARQIDELVRQSETARKEVYGVNHDEDVANFYNLFERTRRMPTFRPRIAAPQLQLLLLQEAAEATDTNMRVFIHKEEGRDKQREKAFQEHWKQEFFNLQLLMAQIYAQFSGTAWLQVGNDPFAKRGKGNVWLRARLPKNVHVDPISPWPEDWTWQVFEDFVYLDQIKYTKSLQDAAEQQMTNNYENARRLNNGVVVIHASTGITANTFGGLPGEIVVVGANSPPGQGIDIKYPPPFAAQQMDYPMKLLALQKELRGATPARQGNMNPGNVGPDLFEAAVSQSQAGTRLTARLFAWTVQKIAELTFYTMAKSYTDERVYRDKDKVMKWEPDSAAEDYEVQVPEGAVRPMSQSALRSMVIELKKAAMIDTRHALEIMDIPDADDIADAIEKEMALAALAKGVKK